MVPMTCHVQIFFVFSGESVHVIARKYFGNKCVCYLLRIKLFVGILANKEGRMQSYTFLLFFSDIVIMILSLFDNNNPLRKK